MTLCALVLLISVVIIINVSVVPQQMLNLFRKSSLPLWCSLVTETVLLMSEESQESMVKKVFIGRMFVILGEKFAEMAESDFVEPSRPWWPQSWFGDDAMTILKYRRAARRVSRTTQSLVNFWEEHTETISAKLTVGRSQVGTTCSFVPTRPSSVSMWMTS